jgi:hypothetical protein
VQPLGEKIPWEIEAGPAHTVVLNGNVARIK